MHSDWATAATLVGMAVAVAAVKIAEVIIAKGCS